MDWHSEFVKFTKLTDYLKKKHPSYLKMHKVNLIHTALKGVTDFRNGEYVCMIKDPAKKRDALTALDKINQYLILEIRKSEQKPLPPVKPLFGKINLKPIHKVALIGGVSLVVLYLVAKKRRPRSNPQNERGERIIERIIEKVPEKEIVREKEVKTDE